MNKEERIKEMARIMIEARRAPVKDLGQVIANAINYAATYLGTPEKLIASRTGRWEAEIIRRMAAGGELFLPPTDEAYAMQLKPLFIAMGQAGEDGSDVLSQAMGIAINELGGIDEFTGETWWHDDLYSLGRQYS